MRIVSYSSSSIPFPACPASKIQHSPVRPKSSNTQLAELPHRKYTHLSFSLPLFLLLHFTLLLHPIPRPLSIRPLPPSKTVPRPDPFHARTPARLFLPPQAPSDSAHICIALHSSSAPATRPHWENRASFPLLLISFSPPSPPVRYPPAAVVFPVRGGGGGISIGSTAQLSSGE